MKQLIMVVKLHDLSWIIHVLMRVKNQKTTIDNKVRAIEQIFELDPLNLNILDHILLSGKWECYLKVITPNSLGIPNTEIIINND